VQPVVPTSAATPNAVTEMALVLFIRRSSASRRTAKHRSAHADRRDLYLVGLFQLDLKVERLSDHSI
jgi:hypothetical protein